MDPEHWLSSTWDGLAFGIIVAAAFFLVPEEMPRPELPQTARAGEVSLQHDSVLLLHYCLLLGLFPTGGKTMIADPSVVP